MSYDINFWRPTKGLLLEPLLVYRRLSNGKSVEGLMRLPVKRILKSLSEAFPNFDPAEEFPLVRLNDGSMEVSSNSLYFRFDFRGGGDTDAERHTVWQIMTGFECVCFDPQVNQLYPSDAPSPYAIRSAPRKKAKHGLIADVDKERERLKKLNVRGSELERRMGEWLMEYCLGKPKAKKKR